MRLLSRSAPAVSRSGNICHIEPLEKRCMLSDTSGESTTLQASSLSTGIVSGTAKKWHAISIDFAGPTARQTDTSPNPFKDYRLQVKFTSPSGRSFNVPGYFDGDGRGGSTGNIWRVKFNPDERGTWRYTASFRRGTNIAVDLNASAGTPTHFDGTSGSFSVADRDASAPGTLKWGRLEYVGGHYFKYRDGSYFLKTGTNEPENLLGYYGFVNTPNAVHRYDTHVQDWRSGDPDWDSGRGKGIIGAINYFANNGVNSLYFLPMNIGGQGKDTWPFAGSINRHGSTSNNNLIFDLKKLQQWETVFQHIQKKGMLMHVVFGETEEANKRELDNAALGVERKLFYREMIARFGHHNAVQWNVQEEYNWRYPLSASLMKEWASYVKAVDPYKHPVTVHHTHHPTIGWAPFVGDRNFDVTSFQYYEYSGDPATMKYGQDMEDWRKRTAAAGRPIPISVDEPRITTMSNMARQRKEILWHTLLSGGHLEWIVDKYAWTENFRNYDDIYRWSGYARKFIEQNMPFWEMNPSDHLLTGEHTQYGGGQVLAKHNSVYGIYLPNASSTGTLDLGGTSGTFTQRWFNPRSGQFEGSSRTINGGGKVSLGAPPSASSEDWVVLVTKGYSAPSSISSPAPAPEPSPAPEPAPAPSPSPTPTTSSITSITLINADTNKPVAGYENIASGATIDLAKLPTRNINFLASTSGSVKSVKFQLNSTVKIENLAPYAMFGDNMNGDYYAWRATTGDYVLTVTPYSASNATGTAGTARKISFKFVDSGTGQTATPTPTPTTSSAISAVTMINADTNKPFAGFENIASGATIDLAKLPTRNINFLASTSGSVKSVKFQLNSTVKIENLAPYAMFGDDMNGDYYSWRAATGDYTLTVTPYSASHATGTAGTARKISFRIIDSGPSVSAASSTPTVTSFALINADTNRVISGYSSITSSTTIRFSQLPTRNLNIVANVSGQVGSVRFLLNGLEKIETLAPYALFGDDMNGDYYAWRPATGSYVLSGTAYTLGKATGVAGPTRTLTLRFE